MPWPVAVLFVQSGVIVVRLNGADEAAGLVNHAWLHVGDETTTCVGRRTRPGASGGPLANRSTHRSEAGPPAMAPPGTASQPGAVVVLDIPGLAIDVELRPSHFDRWLDVRIAADAPPFSGVVEAIFTDEELGGFADAVMAALGGGVAVLGGGRAAELRLGVEHQIGGSEDALAIECCLTPQGDDPYPRLELLLFDAEASTLAAMATKVRDLVRTEKWPRP